MQGGASEFKSWVPDAEASVDTTAIMAAYSVNENIDVLFGLSNDRLSDTTVTTMNGTYNIQDQRTAQFWCVLCHPRYRIARFGNLCLLQFDSWIKHEDSLLLTANWR